MKFESIKTFIKGHKKSVIAGVLVTLFIGYSVFGSSGNENKNVQTSTVTKGNVTEQVKVSGKVEPAEGVDLAFEATGKVSNVQVKVGDKVRSGASLSNLNNADVSASLRRANASISSAQADVAQYQAALDAERVKLDELKRGGTGEEVRIAEANVLKAEQTLDDARLNVNVVNDKARIDLENVYDDVQNSLENAYNDADVALNQDIDPLFDEGSDYDYLVFNTADSDIKINIERQKSSIKRAVDDIRAISQTITTDQSTMDSSLITTKSKLSQVQSFLISLDLALEDNTGLSQTTENTYRGYINTARANVNTAIATINAQQQAISGQKTTNTSNIQAANTAVNTAQKSLEIAKKELELKSAPASTEAIKTQEARIRQAQANVSSARARVAQAAADAQGMRADLEKTVLRAPFAGVVTKVDIKKGEIALANEPAITIISEANYEIEAFIPEVDISKVAPGKEADIVLDAYGESVIFKGTISSVDLSETVLEGVATYKIVVQFLEKDERIKSGMTADVDIVVNHKENVLVVPQSAVYMKDGARMVKVWKNEKEIEERKVEIGIRSIDGTIEILSGLNEGEKIVI